MLKNLLFQLSDLKFFHPVENIGDILFQTVFGLIFVFLGITFLIVIFTLLGLIMKKVNSRQKSESKIEKEEPQIKVETDPKNDGQFETDPALIAVVSAAIAAYYAKESKKCDFVVRRIKRL